MGQAGHHVLGRRAVILMNNNIKHFIKKNPIAARVGYAIRELWTRRRMHRFDAIPTNGHKVLFATTEGRYNDSCRPIAEYLHDFSQEIEIVWVYRDKSFIDELPAYVKPVLFESKEYYKELATSCAWIFCYLIPQGTIKRKNQLYIQVWHGDKPIKTIANEAAKGSKLYRNRTAGRRFSENELCDYFVTGSDLFTDIWRRSVGYEGIVVSSGLPRNDVLLKDSDYGDEVRYHLGIPSENMILTYAPTFRDHHIDNGDIGTDIDLVCVLDALEEVYGRPWTCFKRSHGGKAIHLGSTGEDERIIDMSTYADMTDLLVVSDLLITDYSSCAGDFAYTGRPIILYQDDYDLYVRKDRALVIDMESSPFLVARNMDELLTIIRTMPSKDTKTIDRQILDLYRSTQTEHSTEDIADIVLQHMNILDPQAD